MQSAAVLSLALAKRKSLFSFIMHQRRFCVLPRLCRMRTTTKPLLTNSPAHVRLSEPADRRGPSICTADSRRVTSRSFTGSITSSCMFRTPHCCSVSVPRYVICPSFVRR